MLPEVQHVQAKDTVRPSGLAGPVFVVGTVDLATEFCLPGSATSAAYALKGSTLRLLEQLARGEPLPPRSAEAQDLASALADRALLQHALIPVPPLDGEMVTRFSVDVPADEQLALIRPFVLRLDSKGYCYLDHEGRPLAYLSARELTAIRQFGRPRSVEDSLTEHRRRMGDKALSETHFRDLVTRLLGAGLLQDTQNTTAMADRLRAETAKVIKIKQQRVSIMTKYLADAAIEEEARRQRTGHTRIKVIPVQTESQPLLSFGLLFSYAMAHDNERLQEYFEFVRDWCNASIPLLQGDEAPAIFLFSNYIWSHIANMKLSQTAKEKNPLGICIHGGPDTPKYKDDIIRYLELNDHIDVIVHGEGEATLVELLDALKEQIHTRSRDLSVLRDIPGITYRIGSQIVTTAARERLADLDVIPSPYMAGLFDNIGDLPIIMQTIETNRGCPFGCTFCDWGSATLSKIRKFNLERVYADLEWCAKHKVKVVFNTDANFGVFERDVDIAKKVVELREKYGYPKVFESSYAKNQVKHLKKIIEILAAGGVVSTGTLSLQSVSPETLEAIKRSNIKVSKYDEVATEFGKIKLPLIVEMMMGLPGSTTTSFQGDLQQAIDREVHARVNPTELIINSPMNDPDYRAQYDIKTLRPIEDDWKAQNGAIPIKKALVISTSTFDVNQYRQMDRWRQLFLLMENHGVLRQVARFVRHEKDIKEMDFYRQLDDRVHDEPHRWPTIVFTMDAIRDVMVPPGSWKFFIDEIHDYLITELGVADDSALETVLKVQHALLPARDRMFPIELELAHDYANWYQEMLKSKQMGWEQDWTPGVEPLRSFAPARFVVEDPQQLTKVGMGTALGADQDLDWEFDSPVGRALRYRRTAELG